MTLFSATDKVHHTLPIQFEKAPFFIRFRHRKLALRNHPDMNSGHSGVSWFKVGHESDQRRSLAKSPLSCLFPLTYQRQRGICQSISDTKRPLTPIALPMTRFGSSSMSLRRGMEFFSWSCQRLVGMPHCFMSNSRRINP